MEPLLHKGIIDHLIESCPNIESFKLQAFRDDSSGFIPITSTFTDRFDFLSAIQFHNLKSLTLNGFYLGKLDGSFLKPVIHFIDYRFPFIKYSFLFYFK